MGAEVICCVCGCAYTCVTCGCCVTAGTNVVRVSHCEYDARKDVNTRFTVSFVHNVTPIVVIVLGNESELFTHSIRLRSAASYRDDDDRDARLVTRANTHRTEEHQRAQKP